MTVDPGLRATTRPVFESTLAIDCLELVNSTREPETLRRVRRSMTVQRSWSCCPGLRMFDRMGVSDSDSDVAADGSAVLDAPTRAVTDGRESGAIEATRAGGTLADSTMDSRGGGADARTLANDRSGASAWVITCGPVLATVRVSDVSP
jgi:hypothetical protein